MRRAALAALLLAGCSYGADPDLRSDFVLFFPGGSDALDGAARATLDRAAAAAARAPALDLVVAGYTNDAATPQADQILSRLRAQAAADGLLARGVAKRRIELRPRRGLGADPAEESHRVEIRLGS